MSRSKIHLTDSRKIKIDTGYYKQIQQYSREYVDWEPDPDACFPVRCCPKCNVKYELEYQNDGRTGKKCIMINYGTDFPAISITKFELCLNCKK